MNPVLRDWLSVLSVLFTPLTYFVGKMHSEGGSQQERKDLTNRVIPEMRACISALERKLFECEIKVAKLEAREEDRRGRP